MPEANVETFRAVPHGVQQELTLYMRADVAALLRFSVGPSQTSQPLERPRKSGTRLSERR